MMILMNLNKNGNKQGIFIIVEMRCAVKWLLYLLHHITAKLECFLLYVYLKDVHSVVANLNVQFMVCLSTPDNKSTSTNELRNFGVK